MRIIFMGTPDFAVPALQALIDKGYEIIAVYTQPPRPAGRGHKITKSPIQTLAESQNIPVKTPINFRDEQDKKHFEDLNADIAIVAAYGLILPQRILAAPKRGCINIHGSLLPRWRGAAPIHRAILAGDIQTGITIMKMEAGLDTGPMFLKGVTPISPTDTTHSVHDRLSHMGAELLIETLSQIDTLIPIIQTEEGVTYAQKITKEEGFLCGTESAQKIDLMVRALPNVKLGTIKIIEGYPSDETTSEKFGVFLNKQGDMACADTTIYRITKLQTQSGKIMDAASAINGGLIQCVSN